MTSMDDVQAQAYNAAALPTLRKQPIDTNAAIFKYWLEHKDVGVPLTGEITLDDGTTAVVMSTGRIVHWTGGDSVEVV